MPSPTVPSFYPVSRSLTGDAWLAALKSFQLTLWHVSARNVCLWVATCDYEYEIQNVRGCVRDKYVCVTQTKASLRADTSGWSKTNTVIDVVWRAEGSNVWYFLRSRTMNGATMLPSNRQTSEGSYERNSHRRGEMCALRMWKKKGKNTRRHRVRITQGPWGEPPKTAHWRCETWIWLHFFLLNIFVTGEYLSVIQHFRM